MTIDAATRHPLLIPTGGFCYRVEPLDDSVKIDPTSLRLGVDLREARFGMTEKMVLCPYWMRTERSTVRCEYLKREVPSLQDDFSNLADKLKECDVNPSPSSL